MKLLVNLITTSRLLFTVILMIIYKSIPNYWFLICIAIIFSTDFIDGKLARKFHVETFFGSLMDTIADKVLNMALILPLISITKLFWILFILEFMILFINFIGIIYGKKIRALFLGKIKMWFIFGTIFLGYACIFNYLKSIYVIIGLVITLFLDLIVLGDYIMFLVKQDKNKNRFKVRNLADLKYFLFDTDYYKKNL